MYLNGDTVKACLHPGTAKGGAPFVERCRAHAVLAAQVWDGATSFLPTSKFA